MTATPVIQHYRTARAYMLLDFYWSGGPYVEVHVNNRQVHSLNVWDYSTGAPRIPFTGHALRGEVWQWLADTSDRELREYVTAS